MPVLSMEHDTHCADCITYVRTYLQHTHSVGVPEDLVCFCIVAVADVCGSNEELKRIVLLQIKSSTFYLLLQLFHTFLAMAEADTGRACTLNVSRPSVKGLVCGDTYVIQYHVFAMHKDYFTTNDSIRISIYAYMHK